MSCSFIALERQRLARCRLLAELRYRRLPRPGGWSHSGEQFGTEPTSLALLALHSSSSASTVPRQELEPLLACQRPNGLWPAVGNETADVSFWASAVAVNTLMTLGAAPETFAGTLDSLVNCRPLEASWLVRLKFRLSDRQVRFDPTKYGWPWVPDTVSWVRADIDGADHAGTRKETGTDPRQRTRRTGFASEQRCSSIARAPEAGGTRATPSSTAFLCAHTSMRRRSHLPRYDSTTTSR